MAEMARGALEFAGIERIEDRPDRPHLLDCTDLVAAMFAVPEGSDAAKIVRDAGLPNAIVSRAEFDESMKPGGPGEATFALACAALASCLGCRVADGDMWILSDDPHARESDIPSWLNFRKTGAADSQTHPDGNRAAAFAAAIAGIVARNGADRACEFVVSAFRIATSRDAAPRIESPAGKEIPTLTAWIRSEDSVPLWVFLVSKISPLFTIGPGVRIRRGSVRDARAKKTQDCIRRYKAKEISVSEYLVGISATECCMCGVSWIPFAVTKVSTNKVTGAVDKKKIAISACVSSLFQQSNGCTTITTRMI